MHAAPEEHAAWAREGDSTRTRAAAVLLAAFGVAWTILGLAVLAPDAVYSGDIGVKFVQARALAASHFTTLDIPYPGQFLDAAREFFPIRPPFVMTSGGATQAIFSPISAALQAVTVAAAGMRGMIVVTLVAGLLALHAASLQAQRGQAAAVLTAAGLAGPLWFYAISGWEHAPAVALSTLAFAAIVRGPVHVAPLVAGLCLGAGGALRDEVLLLGPGLLLAAWMRTRRWLPLAAVLVGAAVPLACAAVVEVWWFKRPVAAHLRHAVHLLQAALRLTDAPNPDVPVLRPFTLRERYETVVHYWLLGYGRDPWIIGYGLTLAGALTLRLWLRSSTALVAWLLAIAALAAVDLHELVTAPKWLAGLHRVSPYLVIALFPVPAGSVRRGWYVPVVLFATAVYLALAFAGADTSGGKSLGPRLLLPLMPMLTVAAVSTMVMYLRAAAGTDRWIGRIGVSLVAMSAVMHLFGTIPAYVARNHGDAQAVVAVAGSPARVVVADDVFTAQLLFPLYYRKIVFLADTPPLGARLGEMLHAQRIPAAVVVSRLERPSIGLFPLELERSEQQGRMVVQYWVRRP
jgi:hypothetical protein